MLISSCFECHRKCLTPFSLFLSCCVFVIGKLQMRRQSQFNARKKFQYAILCVRAMVRLKRLRYTLEPLRMEDSLRDPYRVKVLRKVSVHFRSSHSRHLKIEITLTELKIRARVNSNYDFKSIFLLFLFNRSQVIDGCAFRVYGHWVKKGEGQNRAALFENTPRTELHSIYLANLSR